MSRVVDYPLRSWDIECETPDGYKVRRDITERKGYDIEAYLKRLEEEGYKIISVCECMAN